MAATVLIALASVLPAGARDAGADDPASRLRSVEEKLEFSRSRADTLEAEARELAEETARLSKRLVAIASRIQARETQITTTETRLASLGGDESKIRENLVKRRRTLAELLAGLQRLEQNPPHSRSSRKMPSEPCAAPCCWVSSFRN